MRIDFVCIVWLEQLDSPQNKWAVTGFCLWELKESSNGVKEKQAGIVEGTSNKKKKMPTHQVNTLPSLILQKD